MVQANDKLKAALMAAQALNQRAKTEKQAKEEEKERKLCEDRERASAVAEAKAEKLKLEAQAKAAAKAAKKPTSADVFPLWADAMKEAFGPDYVVANWTVKERTLVTEMLKLYELEIVQKMAVRFVKSWKERSAKKKLQGMPGIGLLWAMKSDLHGEVMGLTRNAAMKSERLAADEHDASKAESSPTVGWG